MAFVAENVDGIRNSRVNTSALDEILDDFRSLGYNVVYKVLNAADYGVSQIKLGYYYWNEKDLNKLIYYLNLHMRMDV